MTELLPVERWHDTMSELTDGNSVVDRNVYVAYLIEMKEKSMPKRNARGGRLPAAKS